jgi:hypothetical protein
MILSLLHQFGNAAPRVAIAHLGKTQEVIFVQVQFILPTCNGGTSGYLSAESAQRAVATMTQSVKV